MTEEEALWALKSGAPVLYTSSRTISYTATHTTYQRIHAIIKRRGGLNQKEIVTSAEILDNNGRSSLICPIKDLSFAQAERR